MKKKNLITIFWISLLMFFDPGGFVAGHLLGDVFGRVNITDLSFLIMGAVYLIIFGNSVPFPISSYAKKILIWVFILLAYQVLIFGILNPLRYDNLNITKFFLKNRILCYTPFIYFFTYIFARLDTNNSFIKIVIFPTLIIIPLYYITLITGIDIVPYVEMDRFKNSGVIRKFMLSYGFMHFSYYMAFIVIITDKKKYSISSPTKKIIIIAGLLMGLTIILTLTRRELIRLAFIPIFITIVISRIENKALFKKSGKSLVYMLLIIFVLYVSFPKYINHLSLTVQEIVLLVTTGKDSQGKTEYRLQGSGGLKWTKKYIKEDLIFGHGYYPYTFEELRQRIKLRDYYALAYDTAAEVPIYAVLLQCGIMGILLVLPIYVVVIKQSLRLIILLTKSKMYPLSTEILLSLTFIILIIQKFSLDVYGIFSEISGGISATMFYVFCAVFFASIDKINRYRPLAV